MSMVLYAASMFISFSLLACSSGSGNEDSQSDPLEVLEDQVVTDETEDSPSDLPEALDAPEVAEDSADVLQEETEEDIVEDSSVECLGTKYPDSPVIDPDNPVYSDSSYSEEEVREMFAQAKADDNSTYKAYKAALLYPGLLECAFCACGCEAPFFGHLSAVDCFKDMHGFT